MKAHKKWWNSRQIWPDPETHARTSQDTWRAALEWVLAKHHEDRTELEGAVYRELEEQ